MTLRDLISYWWLPLLSSVVWFAMLLGMLLHWIIVDHSRRLPTMASTANIAYISNIGATDLQPLFIVGCVLTAVFLDLSFLAERWLRHHGRLVPNTSRAEKILSILSICCAIVGTVGLICLSIFKTGTHTTLHNIFLFLFIGGYLFSAVFICYGYWRLGINYRHHRLLRTSFRVKLAFVIIETALLIVFVVCSRLHKRDPAAAFEWIVAFVYTLYIASFVIDLYPAVHTKRPNARTSKSGPFVLSDLSGPQDSERCLIDAQVHLDGCESEQDHRPKASSGSTVPFRL